MIIKKTILKKNAAKKLSDYKSLEEIGWHIYSKLSLEEHLQKQATTTKKSFYKKRNFLHYIWKYKLFVPFLTLFNKLLGKYLIKKVPNIWYNKNLQAFDKAFEKSIYDWHKYFISNRSNNRKKWLKTHSIKKMSENSNNAKMLRSMKEILLTMTLEDTAYKEFFNILLINITREMHNAHPKGSIEHLFYGSNSVMDYNYYFIGKELQEGRLIKKCVR